MGVSWTDHWPRPDVYQDLGFKACEALNSLGKDVDWHQPDWAAGVVADAKAADKKASAKKSKAWESVNYDGLREGHDTPYVLQVEQNWNDFHEGLDVTLLKGWAGLPRPARLKWLRFAGQRASLANRTTKPLFDGAAFVFCGTGLYEAQELVSTQGGTVLSGPSRSATHCVYGPKGKTEWGQTSGQGSKKYGECRKYKCTMWPPSTLFQIVEDAPLVLAQQRLAFAAMFSRCLGCTTQRGSCWPDLGCLPPCF